MTMSRTDTSWRCPVCAGEAHLDRFRVPTHGSEGGVDADAFRPSSARFGATTGHVVRCSACGHSSLDELPAPTAVSSAYADAVDEVSLREEPGQLETARRALELVERRASPGRLLDVGCWTGSFVVVAQERGWEAEGLEPSAWASEHARRRGLKVRTGTVEDLQPAWGPFRMVVLSDVLEHLADPGAALDRVRQVVEPGGLLYVTVPDAGSGVARLLGRRWWSVLPMHTQYFTRASIELLLRRTGFVPVWFRTHPKAFSVRYYAERIEGYAPAVARAAVRAADRFGVADRLVAPDLRDRMAVLAVADGR